MLDSRRQDRKHERKGSHCKREKHFVSSLQIVKVPLIFLIPKMSTFETSIKTKLFLKSNVHTQNKRATKLSLTAGFELKFSGSCLPGNNLGFQVAF